jgi:hypothetical protein
MTTEFTANPTALGGNRSYLGTERGHRVLRVIRTDGRRQSLALPARLLPG